MARANTLKLPGFPKFDSVGQEISNQKEIEAPQYEVCVGLANGLLAVKENLIEYWSKDDNLFFNRDGGLGESPQQKVQSQGSQKRKFTASSHPRVSASKEGQGGSFCETIGEGKRNARQVPGR